MDRGLKIFKNIQRLSYAKGLTVAKMCEQARVSPGIISDLKYGRRNNIGNITIEKLIKVLGCTKEDILSESVIGEPIPDAPKADRLVRFLSDATTALREREELRRLVRAAMNANKQQVKSTAILLESITKAQAEGGLYSDDGE